MLLVGSGAVEVVQVYFCGQEKDLEFCGFRLVGEAFGKDTEHIGGNVVFIVDTGEFAHQPDYAGSCLRVGCRV